MQAAKPQPHAGSQGHSSGATPHWGRRSAATNCSVERWRPPTAGCRRVYQRFRGQNQLGASGRGAAARHQARVGMGQGPKGHPSGQQAVSPGLSQQNPGRADCNLRGLPVGSNWRDAYFRQRPRRITPTAARWQPRCSASAAKQQQYGPIQHCSNGTAPVCGRRSAATNCSVERWRPPTAGCRRVYRRFRGQNRLVASGRGTAARHEAHFGMSR